MSTNHVSVAVLRAILRCSRHRRVADRAGLLLRVDCTPTELETALAELARDGFVALTSSEARLTLAGLAVSVATIASRSSIAAPSRVARARTAA